MKLKISFFLLLLLPSLTFSTARRGGMPISVNEATSFGYNQFAVKASIYDGLATDLWKGAGIGIIATIWAQLVVHRILPSWSLLNKYKQAAGNSSHEIGFAFLLLGYTLFAVAANAFSGYIARNTLYDLNKLKKEYHFFQGICFLLIGLVVENDHYFFQDEPVSFYSLAHLAPAIIIMDIIQLLIGKEKKKNKSILGEIGIQRVSIFDEIASKSVNGSDFWHGIFIGLVGSLAYYLVTSDNSNMKSLGLYVLLSSLKASIYRCLGAFIQKVGLKDIDLVQKHGNMFQNVVMILSNAIVLSVLGTNNRKIWEESLVSYLPGMAIMVALELVDLLWVSIEDLKVQKATQPNSQLDDTGGEVVESQ